MISSQDAAPAPAQAQAQAADDMSDLALAGTSAAFLALGVGTAIVAHRRRWGAVDLQVRSVDLREGSGAQHEAKV